MPPTIHVRTHSYNKDIAEVLEMRVVIGGRSFRTKRGSRGVNMANWKAVLANDQSDEYIDIPA